ncbi:MAG: DUF1801 domain-containing protein [Candidatus Didemnitutus sp.]|nr:DUF1801 domain-containing protein [Candidatus Didemnitutus sp.]
MISQAKTVDAYLKGLADGERAVFAKLRKLLTADKKVAESMRYRMPTYQIGENGVGGFNQQKHYLCLYLTPEAVDPFREQLKAAGLTCGKCCIRFRQPAQLPLPLATKMIKLAVKLAKT